MSQLQRVVNLIKKTGDKAIILDENGEPNYVVMTISDYESLILGKSEVRGLTEDELLAKINREIAIWKENTEREQMPIDQQDFLDDLSNFSELYENFEVDDDGFEPIGEVIRDMDFNFESSLDEDSSQEEEEDRFYFEAVE